jgi:hypothetical protein
MTDGSTAAGGTELTEFSFITKATYTLEPARKGGIDGYESSLCYHCDDPACANKPFAKKETFEAWCRVANVHVGDAGFDYEKRRAAYKVMHCALYKSKKKCRHFKQSSIARRPAKRGAVKRAVSVQNRSTTTTTKESDEQTDAENAPPSIQCRTDTRAIPSDLDVLAATAVMHSKTL